MISRELLERIEKEDFGRTERVVEIQIHLLRSDGMIHACFQRPRSVEPQEVEIDGRFHTLSIIRRVSHCQTDAGRALAIQTPNPEKGVLVLPLTGTHTPFATIRVPSALRKPPSFRPD